MRKVLFFLTLFCLIGFWQSSTAAIRSNHVVEIVAPVVVTQPSFLTHHNLVEYSMTENQAGFAELIDDALSEEAGFDFVQIDMAELTELDVDKTILHSLQHIFPVLVQTNPSHHNIAYIHQPAFWLDKPPQTV